MSPFFLARQPIYDRQLNVAGYELLFRGDADSDQAEIVDGDRATSEFNLWPGGGPPSQFVGGGTPEINHLAGRAAWREILDFFERALVGSDNG